MQNVHAEYTYEYGIFMQNVLRSMQNWTLVFLPFVKSFSAFGHLPFGWFSFNGHSFGMRWLWLYEGLFWYAMLNGIDLCFMVYIKPNSMSPFNSTHTHYSSEPLVHSLIDRIEFQIFNLSTLEAFMPNEYWEDFLNFSN